MPTLETVYIRLDKLPQGRNHAPQVEGRAMARNWDKLNVAADELQIKPLKGFLFSRANPTAKEVWFPPNEALLTIGKLKSRVASNARSFDKARLLLRDLNSYENILSAAASRGSKFYFSITAIS